jgi:hypothetical protein
MWQAENRRFERLEDLFRSFVVGGYDEFLEGCADDLTLNVRGSAGLATIVPKTQIPQWHQSTQYLAGDAFRSSVCFVLITEPVGIVVLTHEICRGGVFFRYETVNHCTLRGDLLGTWFSYPLSSADYAEAWGLPATMTSDCSS